MAGKLIVVSGPSGVGKGTVLRELFERRLFPLEMSISATTRIPRAGEIDGVHYRFLTRDEFLRRKEAGEFLECFEVYAGGAWYGTLRETVESALAAGKWVVLEIDVKGAREVLRTYPDAETIFILPPDVETLEQRLAGRGSESAQSLAKRLAQAKEEIAQSGFYRKKIVNMTVSQAVNDLAEYLASVQ